MILRRRCLQRERLTNTKKEKKKKERARYELVAQSTHGRTANREATRQTAAQFSEINTFPLIEIRGKKKAKPLAARERGHEKRKITVLILRAGRDTNYMHRSRASSQQHVTNSEHLPFTSARTFKYYTIVRTYLKFSPRILSYTAHFPTASFSRASVSIKTLQLMQAKLLRSFVWSSTCFQILLPLQYLLPLCQILRM